MWTPISSDGDDLENLDDLRGAQIRYSDIAKYTGRKPLAFSEESSEAFTCLIITSAKSYMMP